MKNEQITLPSAHKEIVLSATCGSPIAPLATTLQCCPLLVWSGGEREGVGAGQVAGGLAVVNGALAALVALLPVPRVAGQFPARLLLVELTETTHNTHISPHSTHITHTAHTHTHQPTQHTLTHNQSTQHTHGHMHITHTAHTLTHNRSTQTHTSIHQPSQHTHTNPHLVTLEWTQP